MAEVLTILLLFPVFLVSTVRSYIQSAFEISPARKDVFFRLMNNESLNWRNLLYAVAIVFRKSANSSSIPSSPTCGIIDDTLISKTGTKIEQIGRVYDHVKKSYGFGFRCLLYSFWDGTSLCPLDFSLHAEKGKNKKRPYGLTRKQLKNRFHKERDQNSPGAKRISELKKDKISTALSIIKRASKRGFVPEYLLVDSWYATNNFISEVRKIRNKSIQVLCKMRQDKRLYSYNGEKLNSKALFQALKSKAKRCRKLRSRYIEVVVSYGDVGEVKLFFSRFSKRGKWQLLVTTDLKMSYMDAIKLYNIRWGIEVLFKECKQHLNFGKCQSNDFDAQIAETTLSLILYAMLSFHKRVSSYETLGGMFSTLSRTLIEANLAQRIWAIFCDLLEHVVERLEVNVEKLMSVLFDSKFAWMVDNMILCGIITEPEKIR